MISVGVGLRRKVGTYVNHTCFQVGLWLQIRSPRLRVCRIRREEGQVNRLRGIGCNVQEIKISKETWGKAVLFWENKEKPREQKTQRTKW